MSFGDDIRAFAAKTNLSMDLVVRKVTIDLSNSVIRLSPVDTGRFRGNWMLGIGEPNTLVIDAVDKDGSKSVARIRRLSDLVYAGGVVYITNSLPYARRLEYGWSQQAPSPPGIVRLTVQRYTEYIENAVRSLSK